MERYEYQVTRHEAESFAKTIYFCTEQGDCSLQDVPIHEAQALVDLLNERGIEGWELIQLVFGKDGLLACWKRKLTK
jgi:hypothetical protein